MYHGIFVSIARLKNRCVPLCVSSYRSLTLSKSSSENLWTKYNDQLKKRPLLTKCITSGLLSLAADILCQVGFSPTEPEKSTTSLDAARAAKFTALGAFFTGPALHFWYGWLGSIIPGGQLSSVLKRLLLDQCFFAPTFLTSFFSIALLLDGTPEKIIGKIRSDLWSTVQANYIVWVPCQFINFMLVPPHLQVLFANAVGFFWNIYLSYSTYKGPGNGPKLA